MSIRSAGRLCAMARSSSDFLKVRMPVKEMKRPSAAAGEAMQHRGESSPPRFLLQYSRHVLVSVARMDDERQTGCARGGDVVAQALFLRQARAAIVVIVEPGLADCHHLGVTRAAYQLIDRNIELFVRVMRMGPDGAIDIVEALGDGEHFRMSFDSRRDGDNAR